jgi:hypothetical protein
MSSINQVIVREIKMGVGVVQPGQKQQARDDKDLSPACEKIHTSSTSAMSTLHSDWPPPTFPAYCVVAKPISKR